MYQWTDGTYISHHGILGQKWGKKNGPPYPLDYKDHSYKEKKLNSKSRISGKQEDNNKRKGITDKQKKALIIAGVSLTVAGLTYASLTSSGFELIDTGRKYLSDNSVKNWLKNISKSGMIGEANLFINSSEGEIFARYNLWDENTSNILADSEWSSIGAYTGGYYNSINMFLRGLSEGRFSNEYENDIKYLIEKITSGINKFPLKEDIITHRGIGSLDSLAKVIGVDLDVLKNKEASKNLIGNSFIDPAFGSSGASLRDSYGGAKMHIFAPKGTKAMYVDPISEHYGENEILFQRSTRYRIKDIFYDSISNEVTDIFVEVIENLI